MLFWFWMSNNLEDLLQSCLWWEGVWLKWQVLYLYFHSFWPALPKNIWGPAPLIGMGSMCIHAHTYMLDRHLLLSSQCVPMQIFQTTDTNSRLVRASAIWLEKSLACTLLSSRSFCMLHTYFEILMTTQNTFTLWGQEKDERKSK